MIKSKIFEPMDLPVGRDTFLNRQSPVGRNTLLNRQSPIGALNKKEAVTTFETASTYEKKDLTGDLTGDL
jgi:hypothetical protein